MNNPETQAVQARYARRSRDTDTQRYSLFANTAALQEHQERLRAIVDLWQAHGWRTLAGRPITEVGCGGGGNLLDLLRLGATPELLSGIELLPERATAARALLPSKVALIQGDACITRVEEASQQAVLVFTVFSSLLDPSYRKELARTLWRWVAPGGGVLIYDFIMNNPYNPDVRKVPLGELRTLFPEATLYSRRITLAPPIARRLPVGLIAPLSRLAPPLRTHCLTWAVKPA